MAWASGKEAIEGNVAPPVDKDQLIIEWRKAQAALNAAKEAEAALRASVVSTFFPTEAAATDAEGTRNVELGNGWKLKAVFKINRTLNNKDDATDKALAKIEKLGAEGKLWADLMVTWKPELSKRDYDRAPDKYKKILAEVLTEKPGTPSVELVEPKVK